MIEFHEGLTPKSICFRYFGYLGFDRRTSHERLVRVCTNTAKTYSIVIEQPPHSPKARPKILAVGRLIKTPEPDVAMFDLLIGDEAHIPKLSGILLDRLISLGRAFRFQMFAGKLLSIDLDAIALCQKLGFAVHKLSGGGFTQVLLKL